MKKLSKIIYILRMLLFLVSPYFMYVMLRNVLDTKVFGIIFLVLYMILFIKVFVELLIKKNLYKEDIIYNIMQTGVYLYVLVMSIKTIIYNLRVTKVTYDYFKTNYLILSILMVFVLVYSVLEFKSSNK